MNEIIRTIMSILDDENLKNRLYERVNNFASTYSTVMSNLDSSFEEEGDSYVYVMNVPNSLTNDNINVEYDDETNSVKIEVTHSVGNSNYSMTVVEMLPTDADVDTMAATVTNGVFTIVVDKKAEVEPEPEIVQTDPITVKINRKSRK